MSRRRFLKNLSLAGAGLAINPLKSAAQPFNLGPSIKDNPLVISTWIHGMEANAGAWSILESGGDALDAVQKGVAVTENDLNNRSVGLGGRPDRDGRVTLDACIMDHDSRCGSVAFLEDIHAPYRCRSSDHGQDTARDAWWARVHRQWALENGFLQSGLSRCPLPTGAKRL